MTDKIFADGVSINPKETRYGEILKIGIKARTIYGLFSKVHK